MDARKFIIGNVGPIGCIPYQKTINQLKENECVELANQLATQYNSRLKELLGDLNKNLPGATFVHLNVYDLVLELITNYAKYGNFFSFLPVLLRSDTSTQKTITHSKDSILFSYIPSHLITYY